MNIQRYLTTAVVLFTACILPASGQSSSLSTTFAANVGDTGQMFDIVADADLSITGLQVAYRLNPLGDSIRIFIKSGTYDGFEGNAGAWTEHASGELPVSALNTPSPLFVLPTPITLSAGERLGMYIRRAMLSSIALRNGDGSGTLEASDGNLRIFEGISVSNNFGATVPNRIPNVTIHYTLSTPTVRVFAGKRIRTTANRQVIFGLASDDLDVPSVRVRFKRQRTNGSKVTVTRNVAVAPDGTFRTGVKTFAGRNPVRFFASDSSNRTSRPAKVILIRKG